MDPRLSQVLIAQFYVSKNLKKNPASAIKFIINNREYFPNINEQTLEQIQKEHNITLENLENIKVPKLDPLPLAKDQDPSKTKKNLSEIKEKLRLERIGRKFARS